MAEEVCDVVYVSPCGSIATTAPNYASTGLLSKQILSVYRVGFIEINVIKHLHPSYICDEALLHVDSSQFTCIARSLEDSSNVIKVSADTMWNWGYLYTEHDWGTIGHGGQEFQDRVRPVPSALVTGPESTRERLTKDLHILLPCLLRSESERACFYTYLLEKQARDVSTALMAVNVKQHERGSAPVPRLPVAVVGLPQDKSYKRKGAGDGTTSRKKR